MSTNSQLEDAIRARLELDPRIPDPVKVAVLADDGVVRLRGTVGSFRQRRAAFEDAESVSGVDEIEDDIRVRLLVDNSDEAYNDVARLHGVLGISNEIRVITPSSRQPPPGNPGSTRAKGRVFG